MALTCKQAGWGSLAVAGAHATEAQRLELEDHLIDCPRCGEAHTGVLAFVRGLDGLVTDTLTPTSREAVRQAVVNGVQAAKPARGRVSWGRRWALGLAISAAATVGAIVLFRGVAPRPVPYRMLAGDVTAQVADLSVADPARARSLVFRSTAGGRLRVAEAEVGLAPLTEIAWTESQHSLTLVRGDVTVDVQHRPGQRFEVVTPHFRVQVLGTRFTVGLGGVRTERGIVRVMRGAGDSAVVLADVAAGQSWRLDDAPAPAAPFPVASPPLGPRHETKARSPAATLAEARRTLARGETATARRIVAPLFHLGRDVAVEARALFAESFLVEGRYADAVDGYRVVVRDFPGTAQAESALFAIAQLDSEHGRTTDARDALQRYLDRYPHGRFSREAALRLARLSGRAR